MPEVKVSCEVYSRVVGFLRPVSAYNEGKQQEFYDRVNFQLPTKEKLLDVVVQE